MGLRTALGLKAKKMPEASTIPARWFSGKEFTTDWVTGSANYWVSLPDQIDGPVKSILEVGSWEGRSAIVWLNLFPDCHLTCMDAWDLLPSPGRDDNERRFNKNLSEYEARLTKVKSLSMPGLTSLLMDQNTYDLIYIDAWHSREGTLINTVLAWPMLREGGILIWDDYLWQMKLESKRRPKDAIDWFLENNRDELEIIHRGYQVAIRRTSAQSNFRDRNP